MTRHLTLALVALLLAGGLLVRPELSEIVAGVAVFLCGMMALEHGFKRFTGGALEGLLRRTTDRSWKSLLFGLIATAVTQSSSLVSVISISFVSAGLLQLSQGIGIIFGANLGSTTGAWLVAGFGLKVDIAAYAMPMLSFGVLLMFGATRNVRGCGYLLAGLGFLFLGIHFMKEGFEAFGASFDLAAYAVPGVAGLLLFTAIGMVATVVMQSSHATLVLIITALAAGQITYENALALSIGANVGTTVTAILGALRANIAGRRLAAAHVLFNLGTGIVALVLIDVFVAAVERMSALFGIPPDDHTLKLALFHTLFNLVGVLLMMPLSGWLARTLEARMRPPARSVVTPKFISAELAGMPDAGLQAARGELRHLFANVFDIMALALHVEPARLRKGASLEVLDGAPESVRDVDVDDYYQRRVKPLYGDILDFLAALPADPRHAGRAFLLRTAGQRMVEALKDLKHLQKNMVRFLAAPAPHPGGEYVALRRSIALLLHELECLGNSDGQNISRTLAALQARIEGDDPIANGTLDRLIREKRISRENATSLINDAAYASRISRNLLEMAEVLYAPASSVHADDAPAPSLDEQSGTTSTEVACSAQEGKNVP